MEEKLRAFINAHTDRYKVANDAVLWSLIDLFDDFNLLVEDSEESQTLKEKAWANKNTFGWMWENHLVQHDDAADYVESEDNYYTLHVLDEERVVVLEAEYYYSTQTITSNGLGSEECRDYYDIQALSFKKVLEFIE